MPKRWRYYIPKSLLLIETNGAVLISYVKSSFVRRFLILLFLSFFRASYQLRFCCWCRRFVCVVILCFISIEVALFVPTYYIIHIQYYRNNNFEVSNRIVCISAGFVVKLPKMYANPQIFLHPFSNEMKLHCWMQEAIVFFQIHLLMGQLTQKSMEKTSLTFSSPSTWLRPNLEEEEREVVVQL